ncbi:hypothetical protein Taro_003947 [Colocasia esculenta]|uniref:Uncharacterized protein n=1 Tax=Colocasia esculenta TaxID=4460 RepID=A0A843TL40_COLES|nr:hypothetical protein [Colocasia esculenta]
MSLHLVGVVWRSSWRMGSRRSSTPGRSSSPLRLLRPTQIVIMKSTKGYYDVQEEEQVEDGNASESSWRLGSRRSSTPSRSSSPLRLLRPTQIVIMESTKGADPVNATAR